jgi:hypothetical protein
MSDATSRTAETPGGRVFWLSAAVGAVIIAVGLRGLWLSSSPRSRASFVRFFVGAGIAHDALWAPAAVVLGLLTARVFPPAIRRTVRLGLTFTALVVVVSWGQVQGYGARTRNPSLLPLDYGRHLALFVVGVWLLVALHAIFQSVRRR